MHSVHESAAYSVVEPLDRDLLRGAGAIASFLFGDDPGGRRRVYHLASASDEKRLPVFYLGSIICARRSTMLTWIAERESRSA